MYRNSATLEDVYRLVLPATTSLLVGEQMLHRAVSWACSLRPSAPAFPKLDGDELALIDMEDLRRLDPQMRLDRVVQSLRSAHISAVVVLGPVNEQAIHAARVANIALFQVPSEESLVPIERAVIRFIVDRAGYVAQRSSDLQHVLNKSALDGGGLESIAEHVHQFAQQPLVILREEGTFAAAAGVHPDALQNQLPNITSLHSWAITQPVDSLSKAVGLMPLATPPHVQPERLPTNPGQLFEFNSGTVRYTEVVVVPINVNETARGYTLLLRHSGQAGQQISAVEEIACHQCAAAAALEWAKQNAVGVAEERMRASFVDELLASEIADEQAWVQRGASLGYDLTRPHVAWVLQVRNVSDWPDPLLRFVDEQKVLVPYSQRDGEVLLFWPVGNPKSGRELKVVANKLVEGIMAAVPKAEIVIGIGRPGATPAQWQQSQQQARESWRLGREWKSAAVTYFGDLDFYRLLTKLSGDAEAARFYRKTLGMLITHDKEHNAELVDTLDAFFICHANLSQTAIHLHIHRNTLTYRLDRIAEITRLDLNDPDARFSLQLALKLRPVLRAGPF